MEVYVIYGFFFTTYLFSEVHNLFKKGLWKKEKTMNEKLAKHVTIDRFPIVAPEVLL